MIQQFLLIVGIDLLYLVVLFLLLYLIYKLSKYVFKILLKSKSKIIITLTSIFSTSVLFSLIIFILMIQSIQENSEPIPREELEKDYLELTYNYLDAVFENQLTKNDIISLFGEFDTTLSNYEFDISMQNSSKQLILKIQFDDNKVSNYELIEK